MADKVTITSGATIRIQRASAWLYVGDQAHQDPRFEGGMIKDSHSRSRPAKGATLRTRSTSMATPWQIGAYVGVNDGASASAN